MYTTKQLLFFVFIPSIVFSQNNFTQQDTLRGSITPQRAWWDIVTYNLDVQVYPKTKSIVGKNTFFYKVLSSEQTLQFELQAPMLVDSITQNQQKLNYTHTGISYFVALTKKQKEKALDSLTVYYHGQPKTAVNPPWDGGIIWKKDTDGNPIIATANQEIGASVWWPCKDHPADEPEEFTLTVTCPTPLINISNGTCTNIKINNDNTRSYTWKTKNPINHYGVSLNMANYSHFKEIYNGLNGKLNCNYYVLPNNLTKAKQQFKDVARTLTAFEYWFGPYPFYNDGYKLVEVPYLGMEHQSCIGYGNGYKNGYDGKKYGDSNWGLQFDYIIIHESGHEWFANSISCKDVADLWIHESFTTYAESLFVDYYYGTKAANEYVQGFKRYVYNDKPIIGTYNVHNQGSTDMYVKGSLLLHTLRQIVNNDVLWRNILLKINKVFYHQTVNTKLIIEFLSNETHLNLHPFFEQYLTTTKIPELLVKKEKNKLFYKWNNVIPNFYMPLKVTLNQQEKWITPNAQKWQEITGTKLTVDPNFFVNLKFTN